MTKIDTFLQTLLIPEETFDFIYSKVSELPLKFFKQGEDYLRFEKKGEIDPITKEQNNYTTLVIVTVPHKDRRVEDLSGGVFDTDISVYMRVI